LGFVFLEEEVINGIGVYKANLNSNNDIENWDKLEYNPNNTNNPINEIPCE